ncbi:L-ascorbate oxidase protein [Trifolium repens]|nr:L-ascorbate oxidase protein [Trifolium repens]
MERRNTSLLSLLCLVLAFLSVSLVQSEDAYKFYTWTVTYGTLSPLGTPQQVILINGQFPGPRLDLITNDNVILNLVNKLDEPFLLTWNGIKQRKNSWQDGVLGTNCAIPPNSNYTYKFQTKDQIGTYTYFPSTKLHKAAGGFGGLNVYHRSVIPIPYSNPDGDFTLLIGDWYKTNHKTLSQSLDSGKSLGFPDGLLINGQVHSTFTGNQGKTYMFRISNVGLLPAAPPATDYDWSMKQARTYRWNLTANAARPNPQGSFHYGTIIPTKRINLANSAPLINGKLRYAVNSVSYINPDTPLKLADYFNIPGVFSDNSIQNTPSNAPAHLATSVLHTSLHDFIEVVFQNNENSVQSWHLDGYDFWVVGYGFGKWTDASRSSYNLVDALTRHTAQVYPNSWTAILVSLDNQGMWNLRSAIWERQYLGQQLYLRVWNAQRTAANEYDVPNNALLCGKALGHHA